MNHRRQAVSPRTGFAAISPEEKVLAVHVARIVGELAGAGTSLSRQDLASRVGARRWGPGQLTNALRVARQRGYITHAGPDCYGTARRGQSSPR